MLKESGYTIKDACDAIGISRSSYYSAKEVRVNEWEGAKDGDLVGRIKRIKRIKSEHPFWGYRRVTAWLKHREGLKVNHKRVQKVMKTHGLLAIQTVHKAKRTPQRRKPRAERPRQYWGIERTIKEEIIWLNEFGSFEEASELIGKWIEEDYNKLYVHSELGYRVQRSLRQDMRVRG